MNAVVQEYGLSMEEAMNERDRLSKKFACDINILVARGRKGEAGAHERSCLCQKFISEIDILRNNLSVGYQNSEMAMLVNKTKPSFLHIVLHMMAVFFRAGFDWRSELMMLLDQKESSFPETIWNAMFVFFQENGTRYPVFISRTLLLKHCGEKAYVLKSDRECRRNLFVCSVCGKIIKETENGCVDI